MKILLVTFDKEMEKKVQELLKDHQIIIAKNGEEALLLNVANDVDVVIYDALAGGIAEEDINRLYDEGFKNVPFIILMDDLFPIDPNNIKPPIKKIISREVEVDKLPKLVQEMVAKKGTAVEEEKAETATATATATAEEKPPEQTEEVSWEELLGTVTQEVKEEKKPEEEVKETPPKEVEKTQETAAVEEVKETAKVETKPEEKPKEVEETKPFEGEISLNKQCLLVSFDMALVEQIEKLIGDKCDLHIARSAKQALQKYKGKPFDIIIFDTISGVFAEKGIKDLYEKGNYKDSLYVLLLDEFLPLDVDKLPVKNLRAIKRETELDILPEIVENAPQITLEAMLESAAAKEEVKEEKKEEETQPVAETVQPPAEEKEEKPTPEVKEEKPTPVEEEKPAETPQPQKVESAPGAPAAPAVSATPAVAVSKEEIERIVEQKINEKVIPLIEELIRSKLSEVYIKAIAREIIEPQINTGEIKEIIREIAEPLVRETLEQLLS